MFTAMLRCTSDSTVICMKFKSNRREIEKALEKQTQTALEAIGGYVEGEVKVRAPVDSGNLRGSYSYVTGDREVTIGTNVEYARHLEMGTSKMSPQEHLEPAISQNEKRIKAIAESYLRR